MPEQIITADFSEIGKQDGKIDWSVSRQWASRPDDQRHRTMEEMLDMLEERTARSSARNIPLSSVRPVLTHDGELAFDVDGETLEPTNYSFSQVCQEIGVQTSIFTKTLADEPELASRVMAHAMAKFDDLEREVQTYQSGSYLRAITGPKYERILDLTIVRAVKRMCEESGGRWQVPVSFAMPGTVRYDYVPTTEETTLYASDRDVYMFLVDQENPIEAGFITDPKTGGRVPDVYSRGFVVWNGECGGVSNGCSTFLLRWCCENRSIRDQKGFQKVSIAHRKNAGELFVSKLLPALTSFVNGSSTGIADGIEAAKRVGLCRDSDRLTVLTKALGLTDTEAEAVNQKSIEEEGRPIETVFDAVQGLTAWARQFANQDRRVPIERAAGKLMAKVAQEYEMA